jgi:hypothetical protein
LQRKNRSHLGFLLLAASPAFSFLGTSIGGAQTSASARVALYAAVGPELTHYDVDVESAALIKRGTVIMASPLSGSTPIREPSIPTEIK